MHRQSTQDQQKLIGMDRTQAAPPSHQAAAAKAQYAHTQSQQYSAQ